MKNKTIVTPKNLRLDRIVNDEGDKGTIVSIVDKHNVEVLFDNGGQGIWCFVEGCEEYEKDKEDILYYE